jgi:hypothetical protein
MAHRFFFFAGGDYQEGQGNAFTSNFIQYLSAILSHQFSIIGGIYQPSPLLNVVWALNRAQNPVRFPDRDPIISSSVQQILSCAQTPVSKVTLVSSSYGSVVAGQAACFLAEKQIREKILAKPFDLALGASMISEKSALFKRLLHYRDRGIIGTILYHELQDEGDNSKGIGGVSKWDAYTNALGICFPFLSVRHKGPSFLNNHPVKGHLHRVRAQSEQKARDFIQTILIDHQLGGHENKEKASRVLRSRI